MTHDDKNKALWREAEKLIGEDGALQMVDPLHVIETVMRYFYSLAQSGHKANAPLDEVRKHYGGQHLISGNQSAHQWGL